MDSMRMLEVATDTVPWVPINDRAAFKPVRFAADGRGWVNLIRVAPGAVIPRHRVTHGADGYTLSGAWRDLETDCLSSPGSYTWEPPDSVHEAVVESEEEMVALFVVRGAIEYLDEDDAVSRRDTAETKAAAYRSFCESQGLTPLNLTA